MIFRTCTGCGNRPRHYAEFICWQVSTLLACGVRVSSVRFLLADAILVAGKAHELDGGKANG
jgi:hypothetical protein